jgi:Flp pilus assembly protein TadG
MLRHARGQSMVEMALVLPFLLLVTLGIIELGYYVYTYSELENATRRASERASKTPPLSPDNPNDSNDRCTQLIKTDAINGVTLSDLQNDDITLAFVGTGGRNIGDQIEVSINYTSQFLTPIGRQFFGNTLNFSFTTRRTITSIDPPRGYNTDCSPKTE